MNIPSPAQAALSGPLLGLNGHRYTSGADAFRLDVTLAVPVVLDGPLLLEGLCAAAVYGRTGLMRDSAMANVPIAVAAIAGLMTPLASSYFFDGLVTAGRHTVVRRRRRDEVGPEFYDGAPRARGKDPWEVEQSTGDYLALLRRYQAFDATTVSWVGVGDGEAVADLVRSLHFIGKRRGQGCGQIAAVAYSSVSASALFPLLHADGAVARPLPVAVAQALDVACSPSNARLAQCATEHPAWAHRPTLCVMPDPMRRRADEPATADGAFFE